MNTVPCFGNGPHANTGVSYVPVSRDLPAALGCVVDHGDGRPAVVVGLAGGVRPAAASQPRRRRRESAAGEAPVHAAGVPAAPLGAHPGDDFAKYPMIPTVN